MNEEWKKVKKFHEVFGHPVSSIPTLLKPDRVMLRYSWMLDEINEFMDSKDIYDQSDAIIDLIYFALGTMVEMGVKPDAIFDIVHNANMTKLWADGLPHYNEAGKTIKPKEWVDPKQEIIRTITNIDNIEQE